MQSFTCKRIFNVSKHPTLKSSEGKPRIKERIRSEKKFGLEKAGFILCNNCKNPVTDPESIITVDGQHIHTFTNPAGVTYEIGCFSSADGCIVNGAPTHEHTWFSSFSWCFSHCAVCLEHLGWYYQSENEDFFGLILDHLLDTSTTH